MLRPVSVEWLQPLPVHRFVLTAPLQRLTFNIYSIADGDSCDSCDLSAPRVLGSHDDGRERNALAPESVPPTHSPDQPLRNKKL